MNIIEMELKDIIPYARNARNNDEAVSKVAASIKEFGWQQPIVVDKENVIIVGHTRHKAAQLLKLKTAPVVIAENLTDEQVKAYRLADNKVGEIATWDNELLKLEFEELKINNFDLNLTGFDFSEIDELFKEEEEQDVDPYAHDRDKAGNLNKAFGVAPFSILDTRKGEWLDKKRAWHAVINDNGESREGTLMRGAMGEKIGDVSILDPVMSEIIVRWFGTKGGTAFDPFAGDSVFGFVSSTLGMKFKGIELRKEQAELNQNRCTAAGLNAIYYNDTSENMDAYIDDESIDLVFSCPPYADLEVYSDDPKDLSNMPHDEFFRLYKAILGNTYKKLKNNRFAVVVMGEVRAKDGAYIGTIPKTIEAMESAGYTYYNEIILVNSAGTLPLRAGKSMRATRKVGKMHQNILVFLKGDAKKAVADLGVIEGIIDGEQKDEQ